MSIVPYVTFISLAFIAMYFILSPDGVAKFLLKNEIAKFVETATKEIARLKS
jgi:hypothetical protein